MNIMQPTPREADAGLGEIPTGEQHALRILELVQGKGTALAQRGASDAVLSSWARCINEYHLDPHVVITPPVLSGRDLQQRLQRSADVLECARMDMTTLYQQLAEPESAVVLAGTDGVILHMVCTPEFARDVKPLGFCVGAIWSEREAGTNGMGTCAAARAPVAVRQNDHFFSQYTNLTCSAVPIFDPSGEVTAVLDVTSRSPLLQQHSLVLLGMTAQLIENRLMDARFKDDYSVRFHSRPEFVYTLHEGRLVVDERGGIRAANRSALMQLGFRSFDDIRRQNLHDIFETTLDDMLQRSVRSSFHPVATYRAHVANRFFVVAQQPAPGEAAGAVPPVRSVAVPMGRPGVAVAPDLPAAAERIDEPAPTLEFGDAQIATGFARASRVIQRGIPILLHGETGAGKEIVARAVHRASPMASGAFVAVNCASLPETLIESELFGYRAGAFTGAQKTGRRGKILQASRGTLFLDEIGDMPLALQARLLRVLDERRVTPLGSEESFPVEFQLISASHRNLGDLVAQGQFREDLYYRLNGLTIELPALRDRTDRAALLRQVLQEESGGACRLAPAAEMALLRLRWPGNLRQLRHVMRTLAALHEGRVIELADVPPSLLRELGPELDGPAAGQPALPLSAGTAGAVATAEAEAEAQALEALNPFEANERELMLRTLEAHRWNISHAAKALGVSRNTVYRKLHKYRIDFSSAPGE